MKLTTCVLLVLCLFLFGCPPKPVYVPISERADQSTQVSQQEVKRPGSDTAGQKDRDRAAIEEETLQRDLERQRMLQEQMKKEAASLFKDILFEYDSYTVGNEYEGVIKEVATFLSRNQSAKVTVEGHCDERGTVEYNLALGQKRAEAVKNLLVKAGTKEERVKAVSYGKEMPVDPGHTEQAWVKNRRAHFKIE
jgi:peptidoglycan-associated lipoprotein